MPEKVSTRIAVGIALLVAVFSLLGIDHAFGVGLCYGVLVATAVAVGAAELSKLAAGAGAPPFGWLLVPTVFVLILERGIGEDRHIEWLVNLELPTLLVFALLVFLPPLMGQPSREKFLSISTTIMGLFYVWFLGHFMIRIRYIDLPDVAGETAAIFAILVAKVPDIFAYFIGRTFGKTKLIPSVSPGKTVAGFVGGLLGAVVITLAFSYGTSIGRALSPRMSLPFAIIFGLVSIAGDLVESLFKRSAALKDSASLFPTFGGVLDVIDSILVSAPVVYYGLHAADALRRAQA